MPCRGEKIAPHHGEGAKLERHRFTFGLSSFTVATRECRSGVLVGAQPYRHQIAINKPTVTDLSCFPRLSWAAAGQKNRPVC
jgi:hypothetical protein